jgi:hypothetical protein
MLDNDETGTGAGTSDGTQKTGTGGTAGTPAATQSGASTTTTKVTFTPEQQAELDRILADRLARQKTSIEEQAKKDREEAERKAREDEAAKKGEYETLATERGTRVAELEGQIGTLQTTHRDQLARMQVQLEAQKQGAVDPADVYALLDKAKLEYDPQTGLPTNTETVVKALLDAKPHLVGKRTGGGGVPQTPRGGQQQSRDVIGETIESALGGPPPKKE